MNVLVGGNDTESRNDLSMETVNLPIFWIKKERWPLDYLQEKEDRYGRKNVSEPLL